MKPIILLMILLFSTRVFSQTNIYKFSGSYVRASNTDVSGDITTDEILNLENSIQHPFPEFYFSADGAFVGNERSRFIKRSFMLHAF